VSKDEVLERETTSSEKGLGFKTGKQPLVTKDEVSGRETTSSE